MSRKISVLFVSLIAVICVFQSPAFSAPVDVEYPVLIDDHDTPMPSPTGWYYNALDGDRGFVAQGGVAFTYAADNNNDSYKITAPTVIYTTFCGMWYNLAGIHSDAKSIDFSKIFGKYIVNAYQGQVKEISIKVTSVASPQANTNLKLKFEIKNTADQATTIYASSNLLSVTYPYEFVVPVTASQFTDVKQIVWVVENMQSGDSISVDNVKLKVTVPALSTAPSAEQAFYWSYGWLMNNYNPQTGMLKDKTHDADSDFENVSATAKAAKTTAYACLKGYVTQTDASLIITKTANTLLNSVPRGPQGKNSIWPHFTKNGGTQIIAPVNGYDGSEWASADTVYAAMDMIVALQLIGDPNSQITGFQDFLKAINWAGLMSADGYICHGYKYDGSKIVYDWRGFGMESIGVNWAYASSTGNCTDMLPPPTDNGSGFIENAAYPMVLNVVDRWGNDWPAIRGSSADTQISWYASPAHLNTYLRDAGLFGLSAGEDPTKPFKAQDPNTYVTYGTGGKGSPIDGNDDVIALHYSAMISDIRPSQATIVWERLRDSSAAFLANKIIISPLNNMETMKADKETGAVTAYHMKGSWNLALQTEGWALSGAAIRTALSDAVQQNQFLADGYKIITTPDVKPALRVPADYPTIQAAINAAVNGDVIAISSGTYIESLNINGKCVELKGQNKNSTIVYGDSLTPAIFIGNNISMGTTKISGLKVTNGLYGVYCSKFTGPVRIEDCLIDSDLGTMVGCGIYVEPGDSLKWIENNTISNCGRGIYADQAYLVIYGNTVRSCRGSYGGGIRLDHAFADIRDNSISYCWDSAVEFLNGSIGYVINNRFYSNASWDQPATIESVNSNVLITHNIFQSNYVCHNSLVSAGLDIEKGYVWLFNNVFFMNYGYSAGTKGISVWIRNAVVTAENNIFYKNSNGYANIYSEGTGDKVFSYNDWGGTTDCLPYEGITVGNGNLDLDPLFVDNTDFHLSAQSPCIDKGDPAANMNDSDGSRADMGIYGGQKEPPYQGVIPLIPGTYEVRAVTAKIVAGTPISLAAAGDNNVIDTVTGTITKKQLIVDFGEIYGVWVRLDEGVWQFLHPASPVHIAAGDIDASGVDDIIMDFGRQYGIWIWMNNSYWAQLHDKTARSITAADLNGDGKGEIIVDFGSDYGIWTYYPDQSSWAPLHGISAKAIISGDIDGNGKKDLIVDFGQEYGIWIRYNDTVWTKLHDLSAYNITTGDINGDQKEEVIVNFGDAYGIWSYSASGNAWSFIHSCGAVNMSTGDIDGNGVKDLIIDFGYGKGVWMLKNGTDWVFVHPMSPYFIQTGDLDGSGKDDIICDFGVMYGIWALYDGAAWQKINSATTA